jgi:hypothetical protein
LVSTHLKPDTPNAELSSNLALKQHADFVRSLERAILSLNMFGVHVLTQNKGHLRAIMEEIVER